MELLVRLFSRARLRLSFALESLVEQYGALSKTTSAVSGGDDHRVLRALD